MTPDLKFEPLFAVIWNCQYISLPPDNRTLWNFAVDEDSHYMYVSWLQSQSENLVQLLLRNMAYLIKKDQGVEVMRASHLQVI